MFMNLPALGLPQSSSYITMSIWSVGVKSDVIFASVGCIRVF